MMGEDVEMDPDEIIANALWHNCVDYLDCKTNELEDAAHIIIRHLRSYGYEIVKK